MQAKHIAEDLGFGHLIMERKKPRLWDACNTKCFVLPLLSYASLITSNSEQVIWCAKYSRVLVCFTYVTRQCRIRYLTCSRSTDNKYYITVALL